MLFVVLVAILSIVAIHAQNPISIEYYFNPLSVSFTSDINRFNASLTRSDIVNHVQLKMIPYGETTFNSATGEYKCVNGKDECAVEIAQQCSIKELSLNKNVVDQKFPGWLVVELAWMVHCLKDVPWTKGIFICSFIYIHV